MARLALSWLLILALAAIGRAQPATAPSTPPEISDLLTRLGDDDFQVRDQAQSDLVKMGPDIVPALRQAQMQTSDAEVRIRLTTAIRQIGDDAAAAPTLITLHVKDMPLADVLTELSHQANTTIQIFSGNTARFGMVRGPNLPVNVPVAVPGPAVPTPNVTLDLDAVPFWQAVSVLCRVAGYHPQPTGLPNAITLAPGAITGELGGIAVQRGRFTVVATNFMHVRSTMLGGGPVEKDDRLSVAVYVDPKFKLINIGMPQLDQATDENHVSWRPDPSPMTMIHPTYMEASDFGLQIPLSAPANMGKKLTIRGSIPMVIGTRTKTIEIPDLSQAVQTSQTAGKWTLTVRSCQFTPGQCQVMLGVTTPASPNQIIRGAPPGMAMMQQTRAMFMALRSIQLFDRDGKLISYGAGEGFNGNQFSWNCNFPSAGPPISLKWSAVTETSTVSVPFEIRDIPLPDN